MSNTTDLIFKVIRADLDDFWNDSIRSLIDPEKPEYRRELRYVGPRKGFTYRICKSEGGSRFEVIVTDKKDPSRKSVWNQYIDINEKDDNGFEICINASNNQMLLPEKKWLVLKTPGQSEQEFEQAKQEKIQEAIQFLKDQFTRHQSTSLCVINNETGNYAFKSPPFGHNRSRSELLVGVMLKADLCHIQRVMKYDKGTVGRYYDRNSKNAILKYLKDKKNIHFSSIKALVDSYKGKVDPGEHNEIMAALRFDPNNTDDIKHNINNFAITVFSDNLESRLLAQLRQISFVKLAQEKHEDLESSQVPIIIYGEDKLINYDSENQEKDRGLQGEDVKYQHYVDAIQYIETGSTEGLSENFLNDDFIRLVAQVDRDMLSHLLTTNLDKTCDVITCADTFFMVYKNLDADKQKQLLAQIKNRLLSLHNSHNKDSILHIASERGYVEVVQALLDAGADKEERSPDGCTALMLASDYGHVEVVKALLDARANTNQAKENGCTPLCIACQKGHLEVVQALLAADTDIEAKDNEGWNALMLASDYGHVEVVQALLAAGADIEAKNNEGWNALMKASDIGHVEVVKALLDAGADTEELLPGCWTALRLASDNGHVEVVQALLDAGADNSYLYRGVRCFSISLGTCSVICSVLALTVCAAVPPVGIASICCASLSVLLGFDYLQKTKKLNCCSLSFFSNRGNNEDPTTPLTLQT